MRKISKAILSLLLVSIVAIAPVTVYGSSVNSSSYEKIYASLPYDVQQKIGSIPIQDIKEYEGSHNPKSLLCILVVTFRKIEENLWR